MTTMEIIRRWCSIQIKDSYLVSKKDFDGVIDEILKFEELKRTRKSLKLEWAAHNFLYNLGYERDRVKDVDFDFVQSRKEKILYGIVGRIAWLFIK